MSLTNFCSNQHSNNRQYVFLAWRPSNACRSGHIKKLSGIGCDWRHLFALPATCPMSNMCMWDCHSHCFQPSVILVVNCLAQAKGLSERGSTVFDSIHVRCDTKESSLRFSLSSVIQEFRWDSPCCSTKDQGQLVCHTFGCPRKAFLFSDFLATWMLEVMWMRPNEKDSQVLFLFVTLL